MTKASAEQIRDLVGKLSDDPDPLHNDMTPAVHELGKLGIQILPYLEKSLLSADEMTRLHAQRALEAAVNRHFGFQPGAGWIPREGEASARQAFQQNGSYDFEDDPAARQAAVKAWLDWYAKTAQ